MRAYSSRRRCRKSLVSVVSLAVVVGASSAAQATAVTVIGNNGGPGQNGGVADATARSGSSTDANIVATARGGNGGNGNQITPNGGAGGIASAGAYTGIGGPALIASPQVTVSAAAAGGQGGYSDIGAGGIGGNGGYASLGIVEGGSSLLGADVSITGSVQGGDGRLGPSERLSNAVNGYSNGGALALTQNTTGGSSLNPGGSGGYASSVLNENLAGFSHAPSALTLHVSSTGGNGGAANTFTSTSGQVQPIPGGNGGNTLSSAVGSLSGNGAVTINATAIGGNGGAADTAARISAGQGGAAQLGQVDGQSGTGTVSVSATAIGGGGSNGLAENLNNAVRGQTAGPLSLTQSATGGSALNPGGSGGYASSVLNENLAGFSNAPSSLTLNVSSTGGNGGAAFSSDPAVGTSGGNGGNTLSSAVGSLSGNGAVIINATAIGGNGGVADTAARISAGQGGVAQLGQVGGQSGSGAVSVSGTVIAGNGSKGGSETLNNAVRGQTAGPLSLTQNATGGSALNLGGSGGYASSVLNENLAGFSNAPSSLTLNVSSTGGNGGAAFSSDPAVGTSGGNGGNGGNTLSSAVGSLSGNGAVTINATAIGGNGGAADTAAGISAGQGGAAQLGQVRGQSGSGAVSVSGTAIGGNGEYGVNENLNNLVTGTTAGSLSLTQTAQAGNGFVGGNAVSGLTYSASESTSLTLVSQAVGGIGAFPETGTVAGIPPQSGTARADAGGMAVAGTATAVATARSSAGYFIQSVATQASAPLSSGVSQNVESFASIGQSMRPSSGATGLEAVSYATGFTALTAPTSGSTVEVGSALLQAGGGSSPTAYTASATWAFNPVKLWVPGQSMIVTFSNVGYTGSGLVSFKILLDNVLIGGVGNQGTPVNFAMAQNYFTHSPIDLGTLNAMPQNSTLEVWLSVVSTANGVFDPTVNLYNGPSSSVPEPGALAILILGTLSMVVRRRPKAPR